MLSKEKLSVRYQLVRVLGMRPHMGPEKAACNERPTFASIQLAFAHGTSDVGRPQSRQSRTVSQQQLLRHM